MYKRNLLIRIRYFFSSIQLSVLLLCFVCHMLYICIYYTWHSVGHGGQAGRTNTRNIILHRTHEVRVRCDPRFKWLSVVTIYVVCIVCLLDACPLPPSQLDHNTCASNPEQANSQVKIPFVIDPQENFQIYYATILDVFVRLSLHYIQTLLFSLFPFLRLFLFLFIYLAFHYCAQCTNEGIWQCDRPRSLSPLNLRGQTGLITIMLCTHHQLSSHTGPDHTKTRTNIHWRTSLTSDTINPFTIIL